MTLQKVIVLNNKYVEKAQKIIEDELLLIYNSNYFLLTDRSEKITRDVCVSFYKGDHFKSLKDVYLAYETVVFIRNKREGLQCFCYDGFMNGICCLLLAIKIRKKEINRVFLLKKKVTRGRKRKVDKALVKDNTIHVEKKRKQNKLILYYLLN